MANEGKESGGSKEFGQSPTKGVDYDEAALEDAAEKFGASQNESHEREPDAGADSKEFGKSPTKGVGYDKEALDEAGKRMGTED
jgi:hypothetical protein